MIEPAAADRDRTRLLAEEMSGLAREALAPEDGAIAHWQAFEDTEQIAQVWDESE